MRKAGTIILCYLKPERNMLPEISTVCRSSLKEDKHNFTQVNEVTGFMPGTRKNTFL